MKYIVFLGLCLMVFSCIVCNKETYNTVPKLTYLSATPLKVVRENLLLIYHLQDKEGDITNEITLIKTYLNKKKQFPQPYVVSYPMPVDILQQSNLSATVKVLLNYNQDIGDPQDFKQNDTVIYGAYVTDAANNVSDTTYSDTIIIYKR